MAGDRRYREDEVRAIIDRALQAQDEAGLSHEDLEAIGAAVGLSPEAIGSAARDIDQVRLDEVVRQRVTRVRRRGVLAHAFTFLAVNACLFLVNYLTTPGQWWVLFPIFVWGLALLLHAGFGLGAAVSAKRLSRERGRLQKERARISTAAALPERSAGVRIAEPPDSTSALTTETEPGVANPERLKSTS
jgi:plasmid stability protein